MNITLTPEQQRAHDHILDWANLRKNGLLTLGGLAGVGKTTLLGEVAATLKRGAKRLAFCTASGKASTVLKSKLKDSLGPEDYCGTVHGLIYKLVGKERMRNGRTELYFSANIEKILPFDLIIIDEASMIPEFMFRDLSSFGIPILAVGDHGQLAPVKSSFNLMADPEIKLEKILRQAEGNPIIKMARIAREEGKIQYGDFGQGCIKTSETKFLHQHSYGDINSIVICALNKTRVRMNSFAREILKIQSNTPTVGEHLICLYNNHKKMIYNGNIGTLKEIKHSIIDNKNIYEVVIDMASHFYSGDIVADQFGKEYTNVDDGIDDVDYFDFGFCISCWKAQGSEWNNVLLIEEGEWMLKENWPRFLYTAITRAKERLIIYKR